MTNLSGQTIINFKTFKLQNTVDMTTVASGIYVVTAEYQDKFYSTKV
ncbi:MAG: T9SS type A sorting domain-containing protein [Bacteroidetes bacterium]|nr:T9SS type A sorting domain-containing protein [Bacteroidota bacterium]